MSFESRLSGSFLFERALLLALVGALIYACLTVISPFIPAFIWATILAISTWPYYLALSRAMGNHRRLAAVFLTTLQLMVFVIPAILALDALTTHAPQIEQFIDQTLEWLRGPAPSWLVDVPLAGEMLDKGWRDGKLTSLIDPTKIRALLATAGKWVLHGSASLALNAINIVLAVLMSGFLYSTGEKASSLAFGLAARIGGESGVKATQAAANTIRGVSLGVIGTALIQALLSGVGFAFAHISAAPVLGLLCFLLAVMQLGTSLVWIPAAAWLWHLDQTHWAVFTIAWGIAINVMDNFIKPYFIGLSSPLPFLLIMIGVIGGLLAWGFVGIFLGTTLLGVAYTTLFAWLDGQARSKPA